MLQRPVYTTIPNSLRALSTFPSPVELATNTGTPLVHRRRPDSKTHPVHLIHHRILTILPNLHIRRLRALSVRFRLRLPLCHPLALPRVQRRKVRSSRPSIRPNLLA